MTDCLKTERAVEVHGLKRLGMQESEKKSLQALCRLYKCEIQEAG